LNCKKSQQKYCFLDGLKQEGNLNTCFLSNLLSFENPFLRMAKFVQGEGLKTVTLISLLDHELLYVKKEHKHPPPAGCIHPLII